MTHPRQTIRDYFKTALGSASIAALPSTKIFTSRGVPRHIEDLPAANITTLPEESAVAETCSDELLRELTVTVEVLVRTADDDTVDVDLDDLCEDIEDVFKDDPSLGGNATNCYLTSTTFEAIDIQADYTVGKLRLTYLVTYFA